MKKTTMQVSDGPVDKVSHIAKLESQIPALERERDRLKARVQQLTHWLEMSLMADVCQITDHALRTRIAAKLMRMQGQG